MIIAIDGNPEEVRLSSNPSISDLFAQLRGWCGARQRVLVSVSVEGKAVELLPERGGDSVPPGALAVLTATPKAFALRMIADLKRHLESLGRSHDEAGSLTVAGKYDGALKAFDACFRGWALLTGAMQELGRLLQVDFKTLPCAAGTAEELILKVVESLTRFRDAFRKNDVVQLGDLAQYELKPQLAEWGQILAALGRLGETRA